MNPDGPGPEGVTEILEAAAGGSKEAMERLLPLVYEELRRIASAQMRAERDSHTLQTTALVHEAYLRLVGQVEVDVKNRRQFLGLAAMAMRRLLVDHARARTRQKRGGGAEHVPLHELEVAGVGKGPEIIALNAALERLGAEDPQKASVVELRFFGGLGMRETAEVLGISVRTAERHWTFARAWLHREISAPEPPDEG